VCAILSFLTIGLTSKSFISHKLLHCSISAQVFVDVHQKLGSCPVLFMVT